MSAPTFGILTGGGDCPGLNAVIRAVTKKLLHDSRAKILGIADGFEGLVRDELRPLSFDDVSGILTRGGTILGTSNRGDPFGQIDKIRATYRRRNLEGIVAIGGDGSIAIAGKLSEAGLRFVCVPKTIDNDVEGTDLTFGFDTALGVVAHAVDALHSTADAHRRVMVVEVMGRTAGWIALYGGVAGGADVILIPEIPFDFGTVAAAILDRHKTRRFTIVVVAEGARPVGGDVVVQRIVSDAPEPTRLGGIGALVARELERLTGYEARVTVLGHLQRGGTPSATDRILATRFGSAAADLVESGQWGRMVALQGNVLVPVPLETVAGKRKLVPTDHELIRAAEAIGTHFGRPQ
ncbi:MAG: 6-phosphofructokinase [Planctomycetes bacterium]|nr:6-phosphofructokinase [Planctomycetota bacterium]